MAQFRQFTVIALCLLVSTQAFPKFNLHFLSGDKQAQNTDSNNLSESSLNQESSTTPWSDILLNDGYDIFYRLLEGAGFHNDIASSATCFESSESFASKIGVAVSEFQASHIKNGVFSSTDSLKHAGDVTRHCYETIEESYSKISNYLSQFTDLNEYQTQIQADMFSKLTTLSITYGQIKDALEKQDYKLVGYHFGYALRNFLEVDPPASQLLLAPPAPVSEKPSFVKNLQSTNDNSVTSFSDFFFPLLYHSSTISSPDQISSCSNALTTFNDKLGQVATQLQAEGDGAFKEGVFLFADSLSLIHPLTWECYNVASEIAGSFYTRMVEGFDYEETMLQAFLYHLHIKDSYYNIKASFLNEVGIDWAVIGKELGDTIQILFFD